MSEHNKQSNTANAATRGVFLGGVAVGPAPLLPFRDGAGKGATERNTPSKGGLWRKEQSAGFAMMEVIVSMAITAMLLAAFIELVFQANRAARIGLSNLHAQMYLIEEMEAARDLERSDWSKIAAAACTGISPCHLAFADAAPHAWSFLPGEDTSLPGGFVRWVEIVNDAADPDRKKLITAHVAWNNGVSNREEAVEAYVYNFNP